jgi:hypothetical protein
LLTNPQIGLTGIYELPDRFILFDVGIIEEELVHIKDLLEKGDKIYFIDGYVAIKNTTKYNDYSKGNENQIRAFYREIELLPEKVKKYLIERGFEVLTKDIPTSYPTSYPTIHNTKYINNKSKDINKKQELINNKSEEEDELPFEWGEERTSLEEARKRLADKLHWKN